MVKLFYKCVCQWHFTVARKVASHLPDVPECMNQYVSLHFRELRVLVDQELSDQYGKELQGINMFHCNYQYYTY